MINIKKLILTLTLAFAAALSAKAQLYEVSSFYVPMHENLAPGTEEHIGVEWNDWVVGLFVSERALSNSLWPNLNGC